MDGQLVKTTTILEVVRRSPQVEGTFGIKFTGEADVAEDSSGSIHELFMRQQMWAELGEPRKITVTIDPGDRLNKEAEGGVRED